MTLGNVFKSKNNIIFELILFTVFLKLILLVVGSFAYTTFPFSDKNYSVNFHHPQNEKKYVLPFKTWDAQHYLYLAENGYVKNAESNRFFPLYPVLISVAGVIFRNLLAASYVVSFLLSIGSVILLYKLSLSLFKDTKIALNSVIFLLAFPSAFFLSLPYTESLYLFLSLLFFYFLERKKLKYALLCSFLLPLSRPTGILILIPLAFYILTRRDSIKNLSLPTFNKPITLPISPLYFLIGIPLLGLLTYFLIQFITLGNPFAGITGINSVANWNLANLLDPGSTIRNLLTPTLSLHGFENSLLDRSFFVIFLLFLTVIYKNLPKHYFYFALAIGLVPLLGSFTSYLRYLLPAFPIFLVLAKITNNEKWMLFRYAIIIFFISLQTILFCMHILNYWVA